MSLADDTRHLRERLALCALAAIYLLVFNPVLPHGDALRVARQITNFALIWNPNHLLFDPVGYGTYFLLERLGFAVSPLGAFELLTGISTLVSVWMFHALLARMTAGPLQRWVGTIGLLASASFLFVATSQYYFMIQMPLLLGILFHCYAFSTDRHPGRDTWRLHVIGVLLAISTAIMFNNLVLTLLLGATVAATHGVDRKALRFGYSVRVWLSAAAIGFPVFLIGHRLSGTADGLFSWVLSYQGDSASKLNDLYGLSWSVSSFVSSAAMVVYNTIVGGVVETAGLGGALQALTSGQALEFVPQYGLIALGLLVAPAVLALNVSLALFALRHIAYEPMVRYSIAWVSSYVAFNFLWRVGDEIFWFQLMPITWMLWALSQKHLLAHVSEGGLPGAGLSWRLYAPCVLVGALLAVNTVTVAMPVASAKYFESREQLTRILADGDLLIAPGWDQQKWIAPDDEESTRVLFLMNMALEQDGSPEALEELPRIVSEQISGGGRVIVARLYELDQDLMPWNALSSTGWPRSRITALLSAYCHEPLAEISGISFSLLHRCAPNERGGG